MDDIITTKGRIFMEGRRQPVGRLRGRRAKSKMPDRVAIVRWAVHLRASRSVACFIVNEIEEIISKADTGYKLRTFWCTSARESV